MRCWRPPNNCRTRIYNEIVGRIKQDDSPCRTGRTATGTTGVLPEGKEYPIYARKRGSLQAPEEILLDVNVLRAGPRFFPGRCDDGQSGQHACWRGRRIPLAAEYTLHVKNLETGEGLPAHFLTDVEANAAWAGGQLHAAVCGKRSRYSVR